MYFFAHVFAGVLTGLLFWHLIHDRRALPVCVLGSILPDLIDKPLAFLFPALFGASRTAGHSLLFFCLVTLSGLFLWRYRGTLLGIAFAVGILAHQVFDSLWNLPATWYFPLLGPFPQILIPDYVSHSLWLEFSSPSELLFAIAGCVIVAASYPEIVREYVPWFLACTGPGLRMLIAVFLGISGILLLYDGAIRVAPLFLAPAYAPETCLMAGMLALCGTFVLALVPLPSAPGLGKSHSTGR